MTDFAAPTGLHASSTPEQRVGAIATCARQAVSLGDLADLLQMLGLDGSAVEIAEALARPPVEQPSADDLAEAWDTAARLADQMAALQVEVGHLRADCAALSDERAILTEEAGQLRLAAAERVESRHVCQWDWSDPAKPIQPCSCGRAWPRYVEYEEEDVEPDVEPWESLFGRLRCELPGWGDSVTGQQPRAG